ncbi:hypothetical protein HK096_006683, partial [Nowakowskiella sp. JEL0078]
FELGVAVFFVLLTVVLGVDILILFIVPYKYTTFNASFIVHTFLVYGMHGFGLSFDMSNLKGWSLVIGMLILRFTLWNPWTVSLPPSFMSPVAAHCTGFGICYLCWKLVFWGYKQFDFIIGFFGVKIPLEPIVTIKDISDRSFKIYWGQAMGNYDVNSNLQSATLRRVVSPTSEESTTASYQSSQFHDSTILPDMAEHENIPMKEYLQNPLKIFYKCDPKTKKFHVEINGIVVGESASHETSVSVNGLTPDTRYRVRVWALANSRIKTPSATVLIRTTKIFPHRKASTDTTNSSMGKTFDNSEDSKTTEPKDVADNIMSSYPDEDEILPPPIPPRISSIVDKRFGNLQTVLLDFTTLTQNGSLNLFQQSKIEQKREKGKLMSLVFDKVTTNFKKYPSSFTSDVELGGLSVHDGTTEGSLYTTIVQAKTKKVENSNIEEKFFNMKLEHNPIDKCVDMALSIKILPLEVVYNSQAIRALILFFTPKNPTGSESLSTIQAVVQDKFEGIRSQTLAGLEYAISKHKTFDLKIDFDAPILIFPQE